MTTNEEHLQNAVAALMTGGPTSELLDDVEACIVLVRHERLAVEWGAVAPSEPSQPSGDQPDTPDAHKTGEAL